MFFIALFALTSIALEIRYLKEKDRREDTEEKLRFVVRRADDVFVWCNHEFPQAGDAALFIAGYHSEGTLKEYFGYYHKGSIDQFRGNMRFRYINGGLK